MRAAIASIDAGAWTPIKHSNAVYDEDQQRWISNAEVADIDYTTLRSGAKAKRITARLIMRRDKD